MTRYTDPSHITATDVAIRPYTPADERGWLRCSVLSFLQTAYFDSVFREKPRYDHPSIELVAEVNGLIAGVIDVECEDVPGSVCTVCRIDGEAGRGGMIWHLAVHPDYQGRGIGTLLLQEAGRRALHAGIVYFEAWTRDDEETLRWYDSRGFEWISSYLHVYLQGKAEVQDAIHSSIERLMPVSVFAHYTGQDREAMRTRFERVHDCNCYCLRL